MFERRIFLGDLFNQLNNKFLNNSLFEKFDIPLNDTISIRKFLKRTMEELSSVVLFVHQGSMMIC